jgi:hypothetical protein
MTDPKQQTKADEAVKDAMCDIEEALHHETVFIMAYKQPGGQVHMYTDINGQWTGWLNLANMIIHKAITMGIEKEKAAKGANE